MIIKMEVTDADLEPMECESARNNSQPLDNSVVASDGRGGFNCMAEYDLQIVKVTDIQQQHFKMRRSID
ncbi:hypothetical protein [Paraburkholderia strydomiana]|uniref:hypothetical protein n=1 Tax=Paraburkholderia strydomiana TaxID=1245417 RepID=UPI001BE5B566|nr:hypothetical protein [Paraburkholderia strydomiana]MBT2790044.1 hypothetical protein [Paraburkholderia strydomiana]